MSGQIDELLTGWVDIFSIVMSRAQDIELAVKDLFQHLLTVPDKVDEIRKRVCENDACLGDAISSFLQKSKSDAWPRSDSF